MSKGNITLSRFQIAVTKSDKRGAERRGNWLSEKLNQSPNIDEELRVEISEAVRIYQEVIL